MTGLHEPKTIADKIAFLEARAAEGNAEAIELAALSRFALARSDIDQAWHWAALGFRKDALHPEVEAALLAVAPLISVDEVGPCLDLMLTYDERPRLLTKALDLRYGSELDVLVGRLRTHEQGLELWIAGRGPQGVKLSLRTDVATLSANLRLTSEHPLAPAFGQAASLLLPWKGPASFLEVIDESEPVNWISRVAQRPNFVPPAPPLGAIEGATTILIPVYGDVDATRRCLESLFRDGEDPAARNVVLINDASPSSAMQANLQFARAQGAHVITNPRNLGFTASINRGLVLAPPGDVILLNADTLVPPLWMSRLKAVAASDPTIGTVTPFTNNGESASAPIPFIANPLPDQVSIDRISEILWQAHGSQALDLPAGIGFCLYVTKAARAAGGLLDEVHYGRGYLEEVDYCLRLKTAGFRNVCAPGVYVGHKGEASFGLEKAYLVARNTRQLQKLHPDHEAEYQRFALDDPLRNYRAKAVPL